MISTNKPSTTRYGFDNKFSYNTNDRVRTNAAKLNIGVTYFEKTEAVDFPVDLSVGLGLE